MDKTYRSIPNIEDIYISRRDKESAFTKNENTIETQTTLTTTFTLTTNTDYPITTD